MPNEDIPKRWPLVTDVKARQPGNFPPLDAGLVNAIAEFNPQEQSWWVEKRPGYNPYQAYPGALNGYGVFILNHVVLPVFNTGSGPALFTGTTPHPVTGVGLGCRFIEFPYGTTLGQMVFGSGSAAGTWVYDLDGTLQTLAAKSSSTFPPGADDLVPGFAYLDGTLYVMDVTGAIWGSSLTNISVWNALNKVVANESQDDGVYITNHLTYVVAMKEFNTHFFYDNANPPPGSPLSNLQGASLPFGCVNANTVQAMDGSLIWVSQSLNRAKQVAMLEGMNLAIVSTPWVEKLLTAVSQDELFACTIKLEGHRYYVLNLLGTVSKTLSYDIDQKAWYVWTDSEGDVWPIYFAVETYGQPYEGGKLYTIAGQSTYNLDDGVAVPVDIYTPRADFGTTRPKMLSAMYFVCDRVNTTLAVRYNQFDYDPGKWSQFRSVNLNLERPQLSDCGTFYNRAYHFRHYAPTSFRIKAIDLQMELGDM